MATGTANITALYEDVVADLIPFYDDAVLLPNPTLIQNSYNMEGGVGNTMKIPLTNSWTAGNSSVGENQEILGNADQDFLPTSVQLQVVKRGAGTLISEETLEDGGFDVVRNAVLTRLSRSIAQATDEAGFYIALFGAADETKNIANLAVSNDGYSAGELANVSNAEAALIMSPEALAYAVKREPTVKMFNDVNKDNYEMVATVRNGFAQVRPEFVRAIMTSGTIGGDANISASLAQVSASVANLRAENAPTDGAGFYAAVVTPAQELALAKELNGVGGLSTGAIGDLSMLGNQALLDGLIGQAIGCRFYRSNNLPKNIAVA